MCDTHKVDDADDMNHTYPYRWGCQSTQST